MLPKVHVADAVWVDENFTLKHDKPFLLSMANAGTPPPPPPRSPHLLHRPKNKS